MDSLHGQLGQLLTDAQGLLADIAPGASGGQFGMHFGYIILTSEYNLTNFIHIYLIVFPQMIKCLMLLPNLH